MIIDNDPSITRNISVPRDMSSLSCSSFTAGIVEAVLDGLGFVCHLVLFRRPTQLTHLAVRTCHRSQHAHGPTAQSDYDPYQAREVRSRTRGGPENLIPFGPSPFILDHQGHAGTVNDYVMFVLAFRRRKSVECTPRSTRGRRTACLEKEPQPFKN